MDAQHVMVDGGRRGSPDVLALQPMSPPARRRAPASLDSVAVRWELALDASQAALAAAAPSLPREELAARRRELTLERSRVAQMLARLARDTGTQPGPWLSPLPVTPPMLGLATSTRACLFDLDGVLTDSGVVHALAWGEVFDELLQRLTEKTGWHFIPFDRDGDYRAFVDGRSRLEAVHAFLDSRGIRLPEGGPEDPPGADTVHGVAKRKGEAVSHRLHARGVTAVAGARRYLEAAGYARLGRAVVSASASTLPMLELAGLAALVEERVDADVIRVEHLRSRPAPDLLLAACRRLDVDPHEAVTFAHTPAGVAAGKAAGLLVVGIAGHDGETLSGFGADKVAVGLNALLDRRLVESTALARA